MWLRTPSPSAFAAIGAGIMATTAMPPFQGTGLLIVPALTLLLGALRASRSPARTAWLFGVVHQASLLHWLYQLGPDAPIASRTLIPAMATGAIVYVSLFYLLFGWIWGLVRRTFGAPVALALAPPLWVGMEALRSAGELSFPWCLSGAAVLATPWLGLAAAGGEQALGFWAVVAGAVMAAWSAVAARDIAYRIPALALTALLLAASVALVTGSRLPSTPADAPTFSVVAAQADVSLADKWHRERRDSTVVPYTALTAEAARRGADLVVWAETAVPAYLRVASNRVLLDWVSAVADTNDVSLFAGHPDVEAALDGNHRRYNGSSLFDADGVRRDGYAKHHLLPFGEVMPFQRLIPALGRLDLGQAEWRQGALPEPMAVIAHGDTLNIAAMICFESCLAPLSRHAARRGVEMLVNITNDGWFGFTAGPIQHAAMARLRAAETGLPLVRCANNGLSFVTDARGKVLDEAMLGQRRIVIADVTPGAGATTYVRYGTQPLLVLLLVWSAGVAVVAGRKRRG